QLGGDAIAHFDPSIGEIATRAWLTDPKPINFRNGLLALEGHIEAEWDPNDLRVLEARSVGAIAVPMAIDEKGHRAGTRERIASGKATGRLEVRSHSHVTELVFDERDSLRVVGVRYLSGERLYRAERDSTRFRRAPESAEEVRAIREIIISAGAYITPQLLMLSGSRCIGVPKNSRILRSHAHLHDCREGG